MSKGLSFPFSIYQNISEKNIPNGKQCFKRDPQSKKGLDQSERYNHKASQNE